MEMKGKKLLLIAPVFFGYYEEIIKEIRKIEMEADYICDTSSNSNISKAIGRINKNLIRLSVENYFNRDVKPLIKAKQYDYVFVVAGMTFAFTPDMMAQIKALQPSADFVLYQWDSEKNLPYSTGIHPFFDRIYSFDRYDCERDKKYTFLPLFYSPAFAVAAERNEEAGYRYDCMYVGTAHPQKFRDINRIASAVQTIWPRQFIYHYMPSNLKYIYQKLLSKEFKTARHSDFKYEKVSFDDLLKLIKASRCILDAPQEGQTGLTIRTIECLGAKRKLITTNRDIKYYDFYREENILVFDEKIDLNSLFFAEPYKELPRDIYERYSLRSWLNTMLNPIASNN